MDLCFVFLLLIYSLFTAPQFSKLNVQSQSLWLRRTWPHPDSGWEQSHPSLGQSEHWIYFATGVSQVWHKLNETQFYLLVREGITLKTERMGHLPGASGSHFASMMGENLWENGANPQEAARDQVLMTPFDSLNPGTPNTNIPLNTKVLWAN